MQLDTVFHVGGTGGGGHLYTLSVIDLYSGWLDAEAIDSLAQRHAMRALDQLRRRSASRWTSIHTDNGAEFLNHGVEHWCRTHEITRTRGRPSKSSDQARIENANRIFVRSMAGERSTVDLLAPQAIEERRDQLLVDEQRSRVLALSDYPRHVSPNWLGRLIDSDEPLDLSLHLEPLDSGEAVRGLTHRLVELESSRLLDARGGRIASVEREVAYEDVERLRDALERGDERVFSTSLYLRVAGRTAADLERATERTRGTLGGMMAEARPALYEMMPGLRSCLPAGQDHLGRRRNLDTQSVATMIPFSSSQLAVERGLLYGESVHNSSLVVFDPFGPEQENANKVVFAKSGAGKSFACKVEALRALLLGVEYYVIDPEDEYGRIC